MSREKRDLAVLLRRYGLLGFDVERDGATLTGRLQLTIAAEDPVSGTGSASLIVVGENGTLPGLQVRSEKAGGFLYESGLSWWRRRQVAYRPLLDHVSFSGSGLSPIWATETGRTVIGWWHHGGNRHLLIGLRFTEELVRYTQGDPRKVSAVAEKSAWGYGHERPMYLFDDNLSANYESVPFADRLGFVVARAGAALGQLPLVAPLPGGATGAVLLTGDDDQAQLEKYDEQIRLLDGFPISYMMLPHTNHTSETLSRLPASVEFGVHVDALEHPEQYDEICAQQCVAVRELTRARARTVRNHGHLNRGYWGHLSAWEQTNLVLDFNIRAIDGMCSTGSYLPFTVRREDGSWSTHRSLFSTLSDSMHFQRHWPPAEQVRRMTRMADDIEASFPGVLVVNLHPQNVSEMRVAHQTVMAIGRRRGWVALGAESYAEWLDLLDSINLVAAKSSLRLESARSADQVALYWPDKSLREPAVLPSWQGAIDLN